MPTAFASSLWKTFNKRCRSWQRLVRKRKEHIGFGGFETAGNCNVFSTGKP
jgi:hypothetical protein